VEAAIIRGSLHGLQSISELTAKIIETGFTSLVDLVSTGPNHLLHHMMLLLNVALPKNHRIER
jgi:hypothetical protein